jgi:hypothetical protein
MSDKVKVTVVNGWAVYADGEQRHGGEVVEVDRGTAEHWQSRGWVEPVTEKTTARRKRND